MECLNAVIDSGTCKKSSVKPFQPVQLGGTQHAELRIAVREGVRLPVVGQGADICPSVSDERVQADGTFSPGSWLCVGTPAGG